MRTWRERLALETRSLFADLAALARAAFDPATPWPARVLVFLVVAYVVSPVDLIPDFVPVLGWMDELVLVPLAMRLAVRMLPPDLLAKHRAAGGTFQLPAALRVAGTSLIVSLWVLLAIGAYLMLAGPTPAD